MQKEKVIIVGNPNVGKSMLFNKLDHMYSMVANYPHTTVEVKRTDIKIGGREYELVDCPGINSLYIQSEDELVTRDVIIKENPRVIIQCLDSTNIRRSLFLTAQLMELNVPLILSLNIIDETLKKGMWIDSEKLESLLGVPAVETIAPEDKGIKEIIRKLEIVLKNNGSPNYGPTYKAIIEDGIKKISGFFPNNPPSRAVVLQLLIEDKDITSWIENNYDRQLIENIKNAIKEIKRSTPKNFYSIILDDTHSWVEDKVETIIRTAKVNSNSVSEKIGWITRHPVWGWPVLMGIIYMIYILVGKIGAEKLTGLMSEFIFGPINSFIGSLIKVEFFRDFLVGDYGILSTGLTYALGTALPILFMFFLILNILEDSGYLSNLCVLTSRFTKKFGLSGKSILPLMLGFGCKTMATMTTRILDSKKERYIAIFLIAFAIPCSPQMGLILGILGSFSFAAFLTVFGALALAEFLAGIILNRILKEDGATDFILEIPAIRFPDMKNVFTKLYHKMKDFLSEVPMYFMAGAFLLFVLDKTGGLELIRKFLSFVIVSFLSLPIRVTDAFLLCLVKHEAGAVVLIKLIDANLLSYIQVVVSLIVITCFVPCFANIIAMTKRLGTKKTLVMLMVITSSSILTGGIVNWILRVVL